MSGVTFLHASWLVPDSAIVTAAVPVVLAAGANVTAAGGLFEAENQVARHPETGVPDEVTLPEPSVATEEVVVFRRWLPEPLLVTV